MAGGFAVWLTGLSGAGKTTIAQRLERVLIGHIKMHQGSIEQTVS